MNSAFLLLRRSAGKWQEKPRTSTVDGSQSPWGVCVCSVTSLFCRPWTVADQAPLTMELPRQECWSELLFPSPRGLLDPGIKLTSLESPAWADGFFAIVPPRNPQKLRETIQVPKGRILAECRLQLGRGFSGGISSATTALFSGSTNKQTNKQKPLLCWSLCK